MIDTTEPYSLIPVWTVPSRKTDCEYLIGWIKKMVPYTKISPKMLNPRDVTGNTEEEE